MKLKHLKNKNFIIQEIVPFIIFTILLLFTIESKSTAKVKIIISTIMSVFVSIHTSNIRLNYAYNSNKRKSKRILLHIKNEHDEKLKHQLKKRLEIIQSKLLDVYYIIRSTEYDISIYNKYGMTPYLKKIEFNNNSYLLFRLFKAKKKLHHICFEVEWSYENAHYLCLRKKYKNQYGRKELRKKINESRNQIKRIMSDIDNIISIHNNSLRIKKLNKIKQSIYKKRNKTGTLIQNIITTRYAVQYLGAKRNK